MGVEIERKFLLKNDGWRQLAEPGVQFVQGYLQNNTSSSVRIRIEGESANINIKGATLDITRMEYEYSIPLNDAMEMLESLCEKPFIKKQRYKVPFGGMTWEIDVFEGDNQGLVVAEIELESEGQQFSLPDWIDREVSSETRYYNVCLVKHPFCDWEK